MILITTFQRLALTAGSVPIFRKDKPNKMQQREEKSTGQGQN